MSEKRSDRLRSLIAATVTEAAENAAPVGITGSTVAASPPLEARVKTLDSIPAPEAVDEVDPIVRAADSTRGEPRAALQPATQNTAADIEPTRAPAFEAVSTDVGSTAESTVTPLRAPQRPSKVPKWEKANVTLEPRDLTILQRSDAQARAYGFRIRKGGNPSLFVRAGLRLLDELCDRDPKAWIERIAAITMLGMDAPE